MPEPVAASARVPLPGSRPFSRAVESIDPADPLAAAVDWAHHVDGIRQPARDFAQACQRAERGAGFVRRQRWL